MIQSGKDLLEPYRYLGLTGKNQLVGVADSGLNDLSCFFIDGNEVDIDVSLVIVLKLL